MSEGPKPELNFDFGFTAVDEADIIKDHQEKFKKEILDYEEKLAEYKDKITLMYNKITPFLKNLSESKGDYIHWPDAKRKESIRNFMDELQKIKDK